MTKQLKASQTRIASLEATQAEMAEEHTTQMAAFATCRANLEAESGKLAASTAHNEVHPSSTSLCAQPCLHCPQQGASLLCLTVCLALCILSKNTSRRFLLRQPAFWNSWTTSEQWP